MKKTFTLFLLSFLAATFTFANTVIVKGRVKNTNGNYVYYKAVRISTDSVGNIATCSVNHLKYTDSSGYYTDTITCTGDIKKLRLIVENCDGSKLINIPEVSASNIVESNFTVCVPVVTPTPPPAPICNAIFTYNASGLDVKFNSAASGDSIVSRTWNFGDSTTVLTGNTVDPSHSYAKAGIYSVCLTIKKSNGCESKTCANVVATGVNVTCLAQFSFEKTATQKIKFNSTASFAVTGDSIIKRTWRFGDGTSLSGNEISPSKEYAQQGTYTVCLNTTTAKGCTNEVCKTVTLQDSSRLPVSNAAIKIISINPNPVTTRMLVTIWSANNNTAVELGISDIYGMRKWSMKKTLMQGNNVIEINTGFLTGGPYFFKVGSAYGTLSRSFYKL